MKLIIATGIYYPDIGGPATYSKLIASEFKKEGKDVVVVTYSDFLKNKLDEKESFRIVRVVRGRGLLAKIKRYFMYYKAIKKEATKDSVIFAQDPISSGIPAMLVSKVKKSRFILKVVGDYAWEQGSLRYKIKDFPDEFQNKKYNFFVELLKFLERWVAKNAEKIILPSEYLKKIVLMWGVEKDKLKVVLNAYTPNTKKYTEKKNNKKYTLLSVGRLVPWKGFSFLISLMPDILKEKENVILNIVGDGPERKNLEKLVEKLNLKDKVFLKGRLSKDDLKKELEASDVFVLNTAYEGLSHQFLELMDMAIPIITTNVGGNPETIENEKSGILLDFNDKKAFKAQILRLLEDEKLRDYLTQNAKNSLTKFDKDIMFKKLASVLYTQF